MKKEESGGLSKDGFTLVEVLIVLAVVSFMAVVIAPGFFGARTKEVLTSMTNRIVADLRNASERARVQEESNQWGIRFTNPTGAGNDYYEIWYGTDYASGTKIVKIYLSPGLVLTDPPDNSNKDIIFSKATGLSASSTTIAIDSSAVSPNHVGVIYLTKSGKIDFEVAANLFGYWDFDEATGTVAYDNAGQGNNGTVTGTAIIGGKIGNARNFIATTDKIVTPSNAILNTDTHTIAFWLEVTQTPPASFTQIMAYRPAGTDRSPGIWLNPSNACIHWRYDPGNSGPVACGGPSGENTYFTLGTWYHIVGVKDGATFTFYVNGTQTETGAVANPKTAGNAAVEIGQTAYSSALFAIDDLRIYNRALSATEIQNLYNMTNK